MPKPDRDSVTEWVSRQWLAACESLAALLVSHLEVSFSAENCLASSCETGAYK